MLLRAVVENRDLRNRLSVAEDKARDCLRFWQIHAPHYTDHGIDHCKTVETLLDELIPESARRNLNEYEVFILLGSVWLHDLGMMKKEEGESDESVREKHHERCAEVILSEFSGILTGHEGVIVADVCRGHRRIDLATLDETRTIHHKDLGDQKVRVRFLSALIRLADSCDICSTRTSSLLDTGSLADEARFYHALHERVSGISFLPDQAAIEISMISQNDTEELLLSEYVVSRLQSELMSVNDILARNGIYYFFVRGKYARPPTALNAIEIPDDIGRDLRAKIRRETLGILERDPSLAFDNIKKLSILGGRANLGMIESISRAFEEKEDYKSTLEVLEFGLKSNPDSPYILTHIGHVKGEYLNDYVGSLQALEKAYQESADDVHVLNYAEALVTAREFKRAMELASAVYSRTETVRHLINARLIIVISFYLMGKKKEGFGLLTSVLNVLPDDFHEHNPWVYNKIRNFIRESELDSASKEILFDLIEVVSKGDEQATRRLRERTQQHV